MIRKRNIIIILSLFLVFMLIFVSIYLLMQQNQTPPTETVPKIDGSGSSEGAGVSQQLDQTPVKLTDGELIDAITKQTPSLLDTNQQPIFGVVSSVKTKSNWYVVTIINKVDPTVGTAKIIMKDSGSAGTIIVAGPGTKFSRDSFTFPDDVWKLL